MHPAVLDGTIHSVGTHAATTNTSSLRVFGGVKTVSVFSTRDFSKDTQFWVHINVTDTTEQEQIFTCTIFTDAGEVLFVLGDVAFRKVLPEQIQAAIKAQKPEDAQRIYEVEWIPATGEADFVGEDDRLLVVKPARAGDLAGLPVAKSVMSAEDAVAAVQTESFTKIVSFAPLEDDVSPADVLDGAMRLIQAVSTYVAMNFKNIHRLLDSIHHLDAHFRYQTSNGPFSAVSKSLVAIKCLVLLGKGLARSTNFHEFHIL